MPVLGQDVILGGEFAGFENEFLRANSDGEASRLANQATFGATRSDIASIRSVGYENWLDGQFQLATTLQRPTLEARRQRLAARELHRDEVATAVLTDVVDGADVRMVESRCRARLPAEARERGGIAREQLGQELEGDGLAEGEVVGPVHLAHPALAEWGDDAVPAGEQRPRREPLARRRGRRVRAGDFGVGRPLGHAN